MLSSIVVTPSQFVSSFQAQLCERSLQQSCTRDLALLTPLTLGSMHEDLEAPGETFKFSPAVARSMYLKHQHWTKVGFAFAHERMKKASNIA